MRSRAVRRARMSESSSASTATRLAIECRPPENRSSDVSSATRAVGRGSRTVISSAFTSAVSDTGLLLVGSGTTVQPTRPDRAAPRVGSLAAEVAVGDTHRDTGHGCQSLGEFPHHDDRAVLAAGAADGDDGMALVLALVALQHGPQRLRVR